MWGWIGCFLDLIDRVHFYDIVHVYACTYKRREREREKEKGVPADLSVKMLGLVF